MKGCKYDQNGTRHLCNCTWPAWSQPHQAMQDTLTSTNMRAKAPYILILTQSSKSMKWCIEHCSMWAQISRWSTCIWKEEESCPQLRSFFFVSFWPQDYPWGKGKTGVQSPRILLSDYHVYNQKIIKSCCLKGEWIHMGGKKTFPIAGVQPVPGFMATYFFEHYTNTSVMPWLWRSGHFGCVFEVLS